MSSVNSVSGVNSALVRAVALVAVLAAGLASTGARAAVALVDVFATGSGPTPKTQMTIARPGVLRPGDVMVAVLSVRLAAPAIAVPAGWTLVRQDAHTITSGGITRSVTQAIYWKRAGASEPTNYTFHWGMSAHAALIGKVFSGVATAGGISAGAPAVGSFVAGSGGAASTPPVLTTSRDVAIVGVAAVGYDMAIPTTLAEVNDGGTGSNDCANPDAGIHAWGAERWTRNPGSTTLNWSPIDLAWVCTTPSAAVPWIGHSIAVRPQIPGGVVLNYRMDEANWPASGTPVIDSSGNNFHASAHGGINTATAIAPRAGQVANATIGTAQRIVLAEPGLRSRVHWSDALTISAWLRLTSLPAGFASFFKQGAAHFGVRTVASSARLFFAPNESYLPNSFNSASWGGSGITPHTWAHVAMVWQSGRATYYLNGVKRGSYNAVENACLDPNDTSGIQIGQTSTGNAPNQQFAGYIDNVCVFDAALTGAQVTAVYNDTTQSCPAP